MAQDTDMPVAGLFRLTAIQHTDGLQPPVRVVGFRQGQQDAHAAMYTGACADDGQADSVGVDVGQGHFSPINPDIARSAAAWPQV